MYQCKKTINDLKTEDESWQDKIIALIKMPVNERCSLSEGTGIYAKIAELSLHLHARVLLYTMAQLAEKEKIGNK